MHPNRLLLLLIVTFVPARLFATGGSPLFDALLLGEQLTMDYQMTKLTQADPLQLEATWHRLQHFDEALLAVQSDKPAAKLVHALHDYRQLLVDNLQRLSAGELEDFAQADAMLQAKNSALTSVAIGEQDAPSPGAEARVMALLLQRLASRYVENAASPFGVSYRQFDEEENIELLADAFAKRFARWERMLQSHRESRSLRRSIRFRWQFIRQRVIDYQHDSVPWLVHRYANDMTRQLLLVANMLEAEGPPSLALK